MVTLTGRAGIWLAALLIAILAVAAAADTGFAIHMGIVAAACLVGLWFTLTKTDYSALAHGFSAAPDQSRYDDDPIRWGVIATVFWGMAGFAAGLFIALQLAFPVPHGLTDLSGEFV